MFGNTWCILVITAACFFRCFLWYVNQLDLILGVMHVNSYYIHVLQNSYLVMDFLPYCYWNFAQRSSLVDLRFMHIKWVVQPIRKIFVYRSSWPLRMLYSQFVFLNLYWFIDYQSVIWLTRTCFPFLCVTDLIIKTGNVFVESEMFCAKCFIAALSQMVCRTVCSAVSSCSYHRVSLAPRQNLPRIILKGIFQGVKVVRGPDWDWGNQDGEWCCWSGGGLLLNH